MKLPAYPNYKASGVKWLGDVPEHWEVLPFTKYVAEKSDYRGKTPEKQPNGVFLVTARNVRMGFIDYESSQEFVAEEDYDEIMRRGLPKKGDILFTTEAPLGNVAIVDREDVAFAQRIIRFRMNPARFYSKFTLFAMMSDHFQLQLQSLSTGSTAEGLKASKLPILRIIAPTFAEQQIIAKFLDRETGQIDRLVTKKRELIERLKEKRTALISRTVTRGLPPAAARAAGLPENLPIKPSGLDWLGDIPAHWEVKKLKYLCKVQTGDKDTVNAVEDGAYPFFVRSQTVERIDSFTFDCEAVLTAGDGVGVGKVFHHHNGPFDFHQRVYMMNKFRRVTGRFFFYFLREQFHKVALEGNAKSTVDSLRMPLFMDFQFTIPPLHEQTAIAAYLDAETAKLDALVAKVETAIERLQEYRTALITAAVTGKIDVRNSVASAEDNQVCSELR